MKSALLLAFSVVSLKAAAISETTSLAHFYSGFSCKGRQLFTAYAAEVQGKWNFGNCWGFTNVKARSIFIVKINKCFKYYPIHPFRCDSYGWVQVHM